MEVKLKKWGNSIGFRILRKIAERFDIDEHSIIELTESQDALIITKKNKPSTLEELLDSIPNDFQYPDDIQDFVASKPLGKEII